MVAMRTFVCITYPSGNNCMNVLQQGYQQNGSIEAQNCNKNGNITETLTSFLCDVF